MRINLLYQTNLEEFSERLNQNLQVWQLMNGRIDSLITLHGILPTNHLNCWQLFVQACSIYRSSYFFLSWWYQQCTCSNETLFITCKSLYDSGFLTLNMHLHLHLKNCFMDYGPCYGFWLFSFERYNGMLGHYHTNQLFIEIQ